MYSVIENTIIKKVYDNGQISLGKEYAGKSIQISKLEDGTIIIKTGQFIPDNEKWLYADDNLKELKQALEWSENNVRSDNFEEIKNKIENG